MSLQGWGPEEEGEGRAEGGGSVRLSSDRRLSSLRVVAWRKFCMAVTGVSSLVELKDVCVGGGGGGGGKDF